jgi:hypothetical protein
MSTGAPNRAKFILSDDIREEMGGKMTIIGYYVDDTIFLGPSLSPNSLPPGIVGGIPQLCLACILFGGAPGTVPISGEIKDPTGKQFAALTGSVEFKAASTSTVAFRGSNVAAPGFGTYDCNITVLQKTFNYSFRILPGPAPAAQTAPSAPNAAPAFPKRSVARRHK